AELGGASLVRARPDGDAEPDEPARGQGSRRDGRDRVAGGRDERGRRRACAPGRRRRADAGVAGASVESDPGGENMIPAAFEYEVAESVEHAIELLGSEDAKLLAGGHSLLPAMRLRLARPALLVDLWRVDGLRGVREDGDRIAIGALTRHHDVAN